MLRCVKMFVLIQEAYNHTFLFGSDVYSSIEHGIPFLYYVLLSHVNSLSWQSENDMTGFHTQNIPKIRFGVSNGRAFSKCFVGVSNPLLLCGYRSFASRGRGLRANFSGRSPGGAVDLNQSSNNIQ